MARHPRTVTVSTRLAVPADVAWRAVQTPELFVHVARGFLRYPVAESAPSPMSVGTELCGRTWLFRVVPFSVHRLRVVDVDHERRVLLTDEGGGVIRRWVHRIHIAEMGHEGCRYEDRIEIDAGVLTVPVAAFAHVFYRHRQRRWRALAPVLRATSRP